MLKAVIASGVISIGAGAVAQALYGPSDLVGGIIFIIGLLVFFALFPTDLSRDR